MPDSAPALAAAGALALRPALGLLLDSQTMVLLGRSVAPPPAEAEFAGGGTAGRWRANAWPTADQSGHVFLAALAADGVLRAQAAGATLVDAAGTSHALGDARRVELDGGLLLDALQEEGVELGRAFEFLRRALGAVAGGEPSPATLKFLFATLTAISRRDGFLEIIGGAEDGGLLLQGWTVQAMPASLDIGVLADGFENARATIATIERPDLPKSARGLLAWCPRLAYAPGAVRRVHFRVGDAYLHLDVVENRTLLETAETLPHLRGMLHELAGEPEALVALKRLCRPRFAGADTVSTLTQPVRAAIDLALYAEGAGVYLTGWVLDPARRVASARVCGADGLAGDVDRDWVRLPRPDVTQGFAKDPLFAERLRASDHRHGFLAFVPLPAPLAADARLWLELALEDDSLAFLPLTLERPEPGAVLARLLGSVNVDDPAIDDIVGRHLGPFAAALGASRKLPAAPAARLRFGRPRPAPRLSIVMPVPPGCADFDVNLAQFAGDPDAADAELVVVAAREGSEPLAATLRRSAKFYEVSGALVLSETRLDAFDAAELGARHAAAETLLFLSPAVLPRERGWLGRLRAAYARLPEPTALSPTLLYEDESIRFAGSPEPPDDASLVALGRFAGYPRHWLARKRAARVWAATMECALMPRGLFLDCGGFARELLGPELKNADFALRLGARGRGAWWVPDVTLFACDDAAAHAVPEYWTRVRTLVDRWAFRRRWRGAAAGDAA